jgi:hypothetical protein
MNMAATPHWITISAATALGVGMLATSAIGVANAMPLVDTSTSAEVPPISTTPLDGKGTIGGGDVTFPVPTSSPAPASTGGPASSPTVERAPAPAPQPVAPRPAATSDTSAASPASPASPASIDD